MSWHWCFSKKYLDYLKTDFPLYHVNVLLFDKRQIYIYVKKMLEFKFKAKKKKDIDLAVFILFYFFHIYIYMNI